MTEENSHSTTPIPLGLCATCRHARVIRSDRGAGFVRCGLADSDARFAKYPRLPVVSCSGYERENSGR